MLTIQNAAVERLAWPHAPLPLAMKMRRAVRPLLFRLWRIVQLYRARRARQVQIENLELRTDPAVFHPGQHFSSKILAYYVAQLPLRNRRVLDMGTGSGVIGIVAARHGAEALAVDVNPHAVELARRNASANHVLLRVQQSNLFEALPHEEIFDWIIFNPPFFAKLAQNDLQAAYNAGEQHEILARFLEEAQSFLASEGKILLIVSSDMALDEMARMLARFGYCFARVEVKPHWFEIFYLVQLVPASQERVIQEESF
jgi:HemK-related putative methylase